MGPKDHQILNAIADGEPHLVAEIRRGTGCTRQQVDRMAAEGYVRAYAGAKLISITDSGLMRLGVLRGETAAKA